MNSERLVDVLAGFARTLVTDYEITDMLAELCDQVMEVLDVDGAGVMLSDDHDGHLRFVAASDEVVRNIETLQVELGEGPCLHAYSTGEQVVIGDLGGTERFPSFAPRALAAGLTAVYSFPMLAGEQRVGAINLYASRAADFAEDDIDAGQILADIATAYILNSRTLSESTRLADQLQHALNSRIVIEQAKGKLAEQLGIGVDAALQLLRAHARRKGRKLHDVAAEVVDGALRLPRP
ncbi:MAG: GAF domain-containing protein [Egibacteraceae bacterium]